jgi:hypothetical protein
LIACKHGGIGCDCLFVSEAAVIAIFKFFASGFWLLREKWRRVQRIGLKDMRHFLDLNLKQFSIV